MWGRAAVGERHCRRLWRSVEHNPNPALQRIFRRFGGVLERRSVQSPHPGRYESRVGVERQSESKCVDVRAHFNAIGAVAVENDERLREGEFVRRKGARGCEERGKKTQSELHLMPAGLCNIQMLSP